MQGPESQSMYSATEVEGKLFLEINDNTTYKGVLEGSAMYDIKQLKEYFQRGEFKVVLKTTSRISIKLCFLQIELQSEMSYQIEELRKQIQQLEGKLKTAGQWEEEDLNSTADFDINYIYKMNFSNGCTMTSVYANATTLTFLVPGRAYSTFSNDRRANTSGYPVAKMMKYKT